MEIEIFKSPNGNYYAELFGQHFRVGYDFLFERANFLRVIANMYNNPSDYESVIMPDRSEYARTIIVVE